MGPFWIEGANFSQPVIVGRYPYLFDLGMSGVTTDPSVTSNTLLQADSPSANVRPSDYSSVHSAERLSNDRLLTFLGLNPSRLPPPTILHIVHVLETTARISRNLLLQSSSDGYSFQLPPQLTVNSDHSVLVKEILACVFLL